MTGSSVNETRPSSCKARICSEDEKVSFDDHELSEKEKVNKNPQEPCKGKIKGNVKSLSRETTNAFFNKWARRDLLVDSLPSRPSSRRSLRSQNGILDPTSFLSEHAQWLKWNDPAFRRQRNNQDKKICSRSSKNKNDDHKSTVASFKRSLQLLGLKDKDLGLDFSSERNNENKTPRGRATPTLSTQLKQRSVSLTNLRNAVQESGLSTFEAIEKMHRDILSRAIYEEWYFRKQTENKVKKELEEEIRRKREEELELIKAERQKKAEENFEKWKKMKAQIQKEKQNKTPDKNDNISLYSKIKPGAEKAFEIWKAKKDEEMKAQAALKKRMEDEEKRKEEIKQKKTAAESAFRAWKEQVDLELKYKLQQNEREKKLAEEKKEKELKEKRESAKICFSKWKSEKDKEIKQFLAQKRAVAKQKAEEITMKKQEKEYEAAQAFEEWLDQIEERQEQKGRRRMFLAGNEIPPWYPA